MFVVARARRPPGDPGDRRRRGDGTARGGGASARAALRRLHLERDGARLRRQRGDPARLGGARVRRRRQRPVLDLLVFALVGAAVVARRSLLLAIVGAAALVLPPLLSLVARVQDTSTAFLSARHLMLSLPFWAALVGVGTVRLAAGGRRAPSSLSPRRPRSRCSRSVTPASARDPRTHSSSWRRRATFTPRQRSGTGSHSGSSRATCSSRTRFPTSAR